MRRGRNKEMEGRNHRKPRESDLLAAEPEVFKIVRCFT